MTIPIIELREIGKQFPGVRALDGVSFDVPSGEVHALLGENGAGKSTLIKIMTGVYQPYHGEILLDGRPIRIGSPVAAQEHGIAAIYQEPMMYPDLSVAENIFITHSGRGPVVRWGETYQEAEAIVGVVAVGRTLVPLTRNIDLSVGSIVGFTTGGYEQ